MIQALIATIVQAVSLMFALAGGAFLEENKGKSQQKAAVCITLSILLAACALGVAAR